MAEILFIQDSDLEDTQNESDETSGSGENQQIQGSDQVCEVDDHGDGDGQYRDPLEVWMDWSRLGPVQRLAKYAECEDSHTRLVSGRVLLEVLRGGGLTSRSESGATSGGAHALDNTVEELEEIVKRLLNDSETCVRVELVEHLPQAIAACKEQGGQTGLHSLANGTLLNVVVGYLRDSEDLVRKTAQSALLSLIEQNLIEHSLLVEKVCPAVLGLTYPDGGTFVKESLPSTINIMAKMTILLGREDTIKLLLPRFKELCREEAFCVRKACASNFGDFCAVVGRQCFEKHLIPSFIKLCSDDIWGVRKACTDVLSVISFFCSSIVRHEILSSLYMPFLEDDSRWVRMAAFQNLGAFISTFANPRITTVTYNHQRELIVTSIETSDADESWRTQQHSHLRVLLEKCIENIDDTNNTSSSELINTQMKKLNVNSEQNTNKDAENAGDDSSKSREIPIVVIEPAEKFDSPGDCESIETNSKTEETVVNNDDSSITESTEFYENNYWYIPPPDLDPSLLSMDDDNVMNHTFTVKGNTSDINYDDASSTSNSIFCNSEMEADRKPTGPEVVPQPLVVYFTSMVNSACGLQLDNEMSYHCAYSFPAVALTLGKSRWSMLKETYETLASDMQWKVRKTVASSLHVIAQILGEEIASKDLSPIFEAFIKDLDEVRIGVLKHMAEFFKTISHECRSSFLPRLGEFWKTDNCCNWRFREELAKQLLACMDDQALFTAFECFTHLGNLSESLLRDKVASVRKIGAQLLVALISRLSDNEIRNDQNFKGKKVTWIFLKALTEEYATSNVWSKRQMYAYLCGLLVKCLPSKRFEKQCLTSLLAISRDAVPNVRLAAAKVLVEDVMKNDYFTNSSFKGYNEVQTVLQQLCNDDDSDVRYQARLIKPEETDEVFNETFGSLNHTITFESNTFSSTLNTLDPEETEDHDGNSSSSSSSISTSSPQVVNNLENHESSNTESTEEETSAQQQQQQEDDDEDEDDVKGGRQTADPILNDFIKKFYAIHNSQLQ